MAKKEFPKTSWSLIARAGVNSREGRAALSVLCLAYRDPVYAFILRSAPSADDASDLTQGFFAQLLERNTLIKVDSGRGSKFRSWLLKCATNYIRSEYKRNHNQQVIPPELLDSLSAETAEGRPKVEPSGGLTPERLYNRRFAETFFDRVLEKTRAKYVAAGKEARFDALKEYLSESSNEATYRDIAASLGIENADTVKKASHDLRARHKKLLYAEAADLLDADSADNPDAIEEELLQLLAMLSDDPE